jgi:transposase-like protein
MEELFKGRHFDQEIVVLWVRWYLSFKLSYRDLVAMMGERGAVLAHTTILRWVQHYTPEFEQPKQRSVAFPSRTELHQSRKREISNDHEKPSCRRRAIGRSGKTPPN